MHPCCTVTRRDDRRLVTVWARRNAPGGKRRLLRAPTTTRGASPCRPRPALAQPPPESMNHETRRPRSTAREIERYGALFAERTSVMKSSAMRDLLALTERADVISLAGGLPDTSTFPAESYASLMGSVAAQSCARALQYGPTEGIELVKGCIGEVMAAEGMTVDPDHVLVTTGSQQVIDLVCKILLDPGDIVITEAPTYPGAVPTFCAYQAEVVQVAVDRDGMLTDELERTLSGLEQAGRRPKFIYTVPNF